MTLTALRLSPESEAAGYHLLHRASLGSTMDEARALADAGVDSPFWLVADEQTGGRGRHGRVWASPPGNLYATLFLASPCAQAHAARLGFVAGLALHDAICAAAPEASGKLRLKWPNDLLLGDAKCAGLLLEGQMRHGRFEITVGFGVNLASAPKDTPYPATCVGRHIAPAQVFEALSGAWVRRLAAFGQGEGFPAIRTEWLARAAFLGQEVTLRLPEGPASGTFVSIEHDGRLVLQQGSTRRVIDAGDLYFRAPVPAS